MSKRFAFVDSPYLVPFDGRFKVKKAATCPPKKERDDATNEEKLAQAIEKLSKRQARLMANDQRAVLVVFQAMDAAGKDGTIRAVMTGVSPIGVRVHAFKAPNKEELDHDFLWRVSRALPERGQIGIWNRSHYEEVLIAKIHPDILDAERLPDRPKGRTLWEERYESIRDYEKHLARNGTRVVKFFLHVSRDEQKKRFFERIEDPNAHWKFQAADVRERKHWDAYMEAYEHALSETSRPWAPWYAIPADDKRYMRRKVAEVLAEALDGMDLEYPELPAAERKKMVLAKAELEAE